ncbi:MAG TPA: chemotaxis protein CheB [Vicinamibacterales bacterium]|jgi:two-component system chemotaxis response regulator CheB
MVANRRSRLVVIGGSAGGIEALRTLASNLPEDFSAPICVVLHTAPDSPGLLPSILARSGALPAEHATSGVRMQPGHFYVAPPDHHLMIEPGALQLTKGPRENRFRPAIDPLFRSAAQTYGPAVIGVLVSGGLDDGTAGLHSIKRLGGATVIQDPGEALYPSMPANAARHVAIDYCVPMAEMGPLLTQLADRPLPGAPRPETPPALEVEVEIAKERNPIDAGVQQLGAPSSIACPECHGVLLQVADDGLLRFRCHTGHAYSVETLIAAIGEGIEATLWAGVRSLEEAQILLKQLAEHMRRHDEAAMRDLVARSKAAGADAEAVRKIALSREALKTTL